MSEKTGRNSFDVTMELVNLHLSAVKRDKGELTEEELERIYVKYYKLVQKYR